MHLATGSSRAVHAAAAAAVAAAALAGLAGAIRVAPGSGCAVQCGNVLDDTTPADIVCDEAAYSGPTGKVFSSCVDCELASGYVYHSGGDVETDQEWMLYNVRYATSYCLFGVPDGDAGSNPCLTSRACQPLQDAITFKNLTVNSTLATTTYDYCASWASLEIPNCVNCLLAGDRVILANLVTMLDAGCTQRPARGLTIGIQGEPFSTTAVQIVSPTPRQGPGNRSSGQLPLGAKVGIGIGVSVIALVAAGCCVVCVGKRRRRAFLGRLERDQSQPLPPMRDLGQGPGGAPAAGTAQWPPLDPLSGPGTAAAATGTPVSQRPLRGGWDDSPMSPGMDGSSAAPLSRYWSPYASPVSPGGAGQAQFPQALSPTTPAAWSREKPMPATPGSLPVEQTGRPGGAGIGAGGQAATGADERPLPPHAGSWPNKGKERVAGGAGAHAATDEYELRDLGYPADALYGTPIARSPPPPGSSGPQPPLLRDPRRQGQGRGQGRGQGPPEAGQPRTADGGGGDGYAI